MPVKHTTSVGDTYEQAVAGERSIRADVALESAGAVVSRYGLVVILLLIGILKFTPAEADGIQPLVAHSPFMSWMYLVLSKQGVSNFVGVVELLIALLLALRPISPRAHSSEAWEPSQRFCSPPASCFPRQAQSSLDRALKYLAVRASS